MGAIPRNGNKKKSTSFKSVPSADPLLSNGVKKSDAPHAAKKSGGWFSWLSRSKKTKSDDDDDQLGDAEPLLTEEEARKKKEEEEAKAEEEAEVKELVTNFKNMTGMWDIDPPDSS